MKVITEKEIIRRRKREERIRKIKDIDWGVVFALISLACWLFLFISMIIKAAAGDLTVPF